MNLPPIIQDFVLHFGEMGSRWGINRTVGQIYALLFVADRPLNAEEITEGLGVSRSNVSMGLKELQSWRLVRLQHLPGDRRDYFSTPDDLWEIVRTLADERKKREIDPTLSVLRDILLHPPGGPQERHAQGRMREMLDLLELLDGWYGEMRRLDTDRLTQLLALGSAVQRVLEFKDRLSFRAGPRTPAGGPATAPAAASDDATPPDHDGSGS